MSELHALQPSLLWKHFATICSIPHPSKHEDALANHIIEWAKNLGLAVKRDPIGNVFIKKPATKGMEDRKPVALQAHIDMVPQKNEDTAHDFTTDPIQAYIDGEWITAKGTTLGSDNGIGMASCLAVLESTDIAHGPLEVLLTIDEEAGMTGAFHLEAGWLDADILINTDSEQEGEVYIGCAGGVNASMIFSIQREAVGDDLRIVKLVLKGLRGGHSGCDIHTGRGNANKLLGQFLAQAEQTFDIKLINFQGGTLRNAIPREAFATIAINPKDYDALEAEFDKFTQTTKAALGKIETTLETSIIPEKTEQKAFSHYDQTRFIATLNAYPNGVMRMDDHFDGVVETSLNVGVITTEDDKVTILTLVRSLLDSGRERVESTLGSLAQLAGAELSLNGTYPGWQPDASSDIMAIFRNVYQDIYGKKPNIMVIHAGLECGLFKKPYPNMDMISFGPTIKFPHSPDEKVHIGSVAQYWEQMVALLANIPKI